MDFPYWDTTMITSVCNHFPKANEADAIKWFGECRTKSLEDLATTSPIPGYKLCQVTHADRTLVEALQSRDLPQALKGKFTQYAEEQLRKTEWSSRDVNSST